MFFLAGQIDFDFRRPCWLYFEFTGMSRKRETACVRYGVIILIIHTCRLRKEGRSRDKFFFSVLVIHRAGGGAWCHTCRRHWRWRRHLRLFKLIDWSIRGLLLLLMLLFDRPGSSGSPCSLPASAQPSFSLCACGPNGSLRPSWYRSAATLLLQLIINQPPFFPISNDKKVESTDFPNSLIYFPTVSICNVNQVSNAMVLKVLQSK